MPRCILRRLIPLLLLPAPALAQSLLDSVEHMFGATNIHAITGHGGLTVGVSRDGDVTALLWPNPSFSDQLGYITSNAWDARERPRFGAAEGGGAFLGLLVEHAGGQREVTWLRDWATTQSYGADDGPNPETVHESAALGLTATVIDAVAPNRDVFVRALRLERAPESDVTSAWLLTYANLSPSPPEARVPELTACRAVRGASRSTTPPSPCGASSPTWGG